ncbi:hypothetical protein [Feifania hominis]
MNSYTVKREKLEKGEMALYDFGAMKLYAYKTNDPIDNEVFLVAKDGRAVVIESPCFFENNSELTRYMEREGLAAEGILLAYHMAGAGFLPGVRRYATKNADEYGHHGGGRALIDQFAGSFGAGFDSSIHTVTDFIEPGPLTIAGIDFVITGTDEAFDIAIPGINAVYTHMLGHDCHSIVAGAAHADAMIAQLEGYLAQGCTLILSSHYTPEDLKDVRVKIDYLRDLKEIASRCCDGAQFRQAVAQRYPDYTGGNYLDMTAGFFFG